MAAVWPASLPQFISVEGYTRGPAQNTVYSESPSGRVKALRLSDAKATRHTFSFSIDPAQLVAFETFWRETLRDGVDPFQGLTDPITSEVVVWQPIGPYQVAPVDALLFRVSFPVLRTDEVPFDSQMVSITLDGSTERLSSSSATCGIADAWTISCWAKNGDSASGYRDLVMISAATPIANIIQFGKDSLTDLYLLTSSSGGVAIKELVWANVLPRNKWKHIVVAYDGSEGGDPLRLYIDRQLVAPTTTLTDTTGTMTDTSRRIRIGQSGADWLGRVHSLAMWNVELPIAAISSIYYGGIDFDLNADRNGYGSAAALQHWFRLGHDVASMGRDFATTPGGTHDLMALAAGVSAPGNLISDVPR